MTYRATGGIPRPLVPIRVIAPFGVYEVVVRDAHASDARAASWVARYIASASAICAATRAF